MNRFELEHRTQPNEVKPAPTRSPSAPQDESPSLYHLQSEVGNQAVQQLLRSRYIQAKLNISNPDDPEEREADQVANTIMRKAAGAPSSTPCACSHDGETCEECQQKESQPAISRRATAPSAPSHVPRIVSDVLRSPAGRSKTPWDLSVDDADSDFKTKPGPHPRERGHYH